MSATDRRRQYSEESPRPHRSRRRRGSDSSDDERSDHHRREDKKTSPGTHPETRSSDRTTESRRHRHDRNHRPGAANDNSHTSYRDRRRDSRHRERELPSHSKSRNISRSRSPRSKRHKRSYSESPPPPRKSRVALPSQDESFRGESNPQGSAAPPVEKQKPNFKPTGLLAKEANTIAGTTTVLKYHEPPEGRKPPAKQQWRMYVFKGRDLLDTIYLHQRSAWLLGRDEKVTDVLLEHPSISKQHAVIQFRHITSTNDYGDKMSKVKPYLIDLESANGTKLNGNKIEPSKFVELIDQDGLAFGDSEREYVLMLPPADS